MNSINSKIWGKILIFKGWTLTETCLEMWYFECKSKSNRQTPSSPSHIPEPSLSTVSWLISYVHIYVFSTSCWQLVYSSICYKLQKCSPNWHKHPWVSAKGFYLPPYIFHGTYFFHQIHKLWKMFWAINLDSGTQITEISAAREQYLCE